MVRTEQAQSPREQFVARKNNQHPAGGIGAIKSSLRHVTRQGDPAEAIKALWRINRDGEFDCPGCAWPDPAGPRTMEFCENGVKAVAWETTGRRVTPEFFAEHTVTELGTKSHHWLESQGRLTHPMRYDPATDRYVATTWDEAFHLIGKALRALDDPNRAIFYTSGRTSNEAAFLYQLFGRRFGTNNFPDCSNMCHESSGFALSESIGVGKGTVLLEDFQHADAIFVIGQNPGTNHPRMLTTLQQAAQRGADIVSINPLRERALESFIHPKDPLRILSGEGTRLGTMFLQPLIGGDLAVITGMILRLFEMEDAAPGTVLDQWFIDQHTRGFETLRDNVRAISWEAIERESGLNRQAITEAAELYARRERVIICWAMGLTQHRHAVATIQAIANLLLLRGMIGKPGAGACPVRGHSNVQGDRTVGITEKPKPEFLAKLGSAFNFNPPAAHGLDTVGAIQEMANGRAKVFIGMGGNFAAATPDTEWTESALQRCDLTVQVSTKLNRSHVVHGRDALILPCLGRTELDLQRGKPQCVTVEDSMSMIHTSTGKKQPASPHLLSEPAIVAGIAKATLRDGGGIAWDDLVADYDVIRDKIEAVVHGFADYNRRVRKPGGFHLWNAASDRVWNTANGMANFIFDTLPDQSLPPGQLRLMTIRSHDQFNTTIYDMDDRYRGIKGTREVIFLNSDDMASRGITEGDKLRVTSHFEDGKRRILDGFRALPFEIPRGCAAAYFPETNVLASVDAYATGSRTPVVKLIPVTVEKLPVAGV